MPVLNGALGALLDWITVRGEEPGPLFVPINKGGRLQIGGAMTAQAIYNMLAKRGASDLLDAGADIVSVQKLLGHANVATTARYDRRGERAKRKAVGLLHVPYQRRRMV